jgi:hypothetical protein
MEKKEIELAEKRSETSTRETRQIELQREEENFYNREERRKTQGCMHFAHSCLLGM